MTIDITLAQPLLNKRQWRYAAKKMNPAKKVPQEKVERILEAARLAPTSSGLQPFEIIVVTDPAVRAKIQPIAWNQAQITDGSHLLVFGRVSPSFTLDIVIARRFSCSFNLKSRPVAGLRPPGRRMMSPTLLSQPRWSHPTQDHISCEVSIKRCTEGIVPHPRQNAMARMKAGRASL